MIGRKLEIAIFVIIFMLCSILLIQPVLKIKATLPINAGMSADEVIKDAYPDIESKDRDYHYITKDDYLFVFVQTDKGYYEFDVGFKNDVSGYILKIPGFVTGDVEDFIINTIPMGDKQYMGLEINRYFNTEYVIIVDERNVHEVTVYVDGVEMKTISSPGGDVRWVHVITDLAQVNEIYAMYEGDKIPIASGQQIAKAFKEGSHAIIH